MAQNHVQAGNTMPWVNSTGEAVVSGQLVAAGKLVGVALGDIAINATGQLALGEVWDVAKAAVAVTQGADLYLKVADKNLTTTATDNIYAGKAFAAAASGAATVLVRLG